MKLVSSSLRYLTTESLDSNQKPVALLCSIEGKPLASGQSPVQVFDDANGKAWARLAAVLPSKSDPVSLADRAAILALDPVSVDDDNAGVRGLYVPAPDFTLAGKKVPAQA